MLERCLQAKSSPMKTTFFILVVTLFTLSVVGQKKPSHIFFLSYYNDSSRFSRYWSDSVRYSKTDFNLVDTVSNWCYKFLYDTSLYTDDSIPPLCIVKFTRNKPLCDSAGFLEAKKVWPGSEVEKEIKENLWFTPRIYFKVYLLKDSTYAISQSNLYKSTTGCVPPYGGGDIFRSGNYIFLNDNFCVSCTSVFWGKVDYCRPILNFLFKDLVSNKNDSIETIFSRLSITSCSIKD